MAWQKSKARLKGQALGAAQLEMKAICRVSRAR